MNTHRGIVRKWMSLSIEVLRISFETKKKKELQYDMTSIFEGG
ncbi:hypothetical protein [Halosquirtibacter laminarini]